MNEDDARPLTRSEADLVRSVFGGAIDTERVTVRRSKWFPFQPRDTVMAPCGHIHFHPKTDLYRADFRDADLHAQGLFIHEMTHVWQTQKRGKYYLPLMRHPFCRYRYRFEPGRSFDRYGLEQQAEIVRHVFLLSRGVTLFGVASLEQLATILPFQVR